MSPKITPAHHIAAKVSSDDGNINIDFDALEYFENELANGNIETVTDALAGCEFSSDYPTDSIAEYFSDTLTKRLFDYLDIVNAGDEHKDTIGFSCEIDSDDFYSWLQSDTTEQS
jgi:hypothetical protein